MGKNWKTTLGGALTAIGAALTQIDDPTLKAIGGVLLVLGPVILGLFGKDSNVTGGSVPQASPPGVAIKSDAMGVVAAVDAIQAPTRIEQIAREEAKEVVAAPPVSPVDVPLCKK